MSKLGLNCYDQSDNIWSIMKSKKDNNVADWKSSIFVEYGTKLSRSIRQCVVYDEDKIGPWHDQSYKSALQWKWN